MKWEYTTELFKHRRGGFMRAKVEPAILTDQLNERAADGWEFVSSSEASDRWTILLIFRRPVPSE